MTPQRDRLEALDWPSNPWLIVLDGCRYDAFADIHAEYLTGSLYRTYNGGHTFTADWFADHLSDTYSVPFFHGGQPIYGFDHNEADYDERDHFDAVPPWQDYRWGDGRISTSLPSGVTDVVRQYAEPDAGGVVRYIQPHNPYRQLPAIHSRTDAMDYGTGELRAAYRDNLRWVLGELRDGLLPWLDGEVVITADHGQAFGEDCCGQYLHAPNYDGCDCLTRVPWFEVAAA